MPNLTHDRERRLRGAAAHSEAAGMGARSLLSSMRCDDLGAFEILFPSYAITVLTLTPALTPNTVDMAIWVAFSLKVFLNTAGVAIPQCSPVLLYN